MNLVFNQFSSWKAPLSYVNITFSCDSSTFLTWIVYLQRLKFTRKETEIEKKERIADFIHPDDGGYLCEDNHSSMLSVPRSLQNRKLDSWQKLTYVVTSCFKIWLHSAAAEQEKRARAVLHKNLFPNQMTHSGRKFYWDPGKKRQENEACEKNREKYYKPHSQKSSLSAQCLFVWLTSCSNSHLWCTVCKGIISSESLWKKRNNRPLLALRCFSAKDNNECSSVNKIQL